MTLSLLVRQLRLDPDFPIHDKDVIEGVLRAANRFYRLYIMRGESHLSSAIELSDLEQEALWAAMQAAPHFDGRGTLRGWCIMAAYRRLRKVQQHDQLGGAILVEEWMEDELPEVINAIEQADDALSVLAFTKKLTIRQRHIFAARYEEDLPSSDAVAQHLGISKMTVRREMLAIRSAYLAYKGDAHEESDKPAGASQTRKLPATD